MKYASRLIAAAVAGLFVSACSPTIDSRGNLPSPEALAQIKPGQTTEEEVQVLLGTPSSTMNYGGEVWHYISSQTETVSFFAPKETDRKVVSVHFDQSGKVAKVTTLGLADAVAVQPVARETPTAGKEYSLTDQLVGNIGRFSKDSGKGGPGGP